MIYKKAILLIILFLLTSLTCFSQVYSTQAGGPWWETSTWVDNVVPAPGDDVILQGPVQLGYNTDVMQLTIQASGKLESAYPINDVIINVGSNIYNYGTIDGELIIFNVGGDIVNVGYWNSGDINFKDTQQHFLESYVGSKFSPSNFRADSAYIYSSGNIYFDSVGVFIHHLYLGNNDPLFPRDTLFLDNHSNLFVDTLVGNNSFVRLENESKIRKYYFFTPYQLVFYDITLKGEVLLESTSSIALAFNFFGDIYLEGSMWPSFGSVSININGNFFNSGEVKASPSGEKFTFLITGNLQSKGTWDCWNVDLNGNGNQHVQIQDSNSTINTLYLDAMKTGDTYQWYRNGNPISNGGKIIGALNQTLILENPYLNEFGDYQCRIDSAGVTFYSRTITINNSTTSVEEPSQNLPNQFNLFQNYPNPFNPNTTIQFLIPKKTFVSLKVFDVLGKEVDQLVNSEMESGVHLVGFDASELSSGIYFYSIEADDFIDVRKMILMK